MDADQITEHLKLNALEMITTRWRDQYQLTLKNIL